MDKKPMEFARTSDTARRAVKITMAAIAATLACVALPQRAEAQESFAADSDGYVPVYDVCFAGSEVGYYSWYNDGYTTFGEITIDSCLLESYGGGPADYDRVLAHEQGHAAGLGHSSDPSSIMYPYTYIFQGGEQDEAPETEQYEPEQDEAPETEQYGTSETEQYEAPETDQQAPEDEQYALDLAAEVQQYEPGQETDAGEAPAIREAPREERPPVRTDDGAEEKAAKEKEAEERKEAEDRRKAEERKEENEARDEAVERVRVEAAALARAVDGADALTGEEPRDRAEALARALEEGEADAEDGPLAEARTEAKAMAESLTEAGERADGSSGDRAGAVAETRKKAEALAGALDRAGSEARREARAEDFEEASADVRTVASNLARAETELEDQETEGQDAGGRPAEDQSTQEKDTEQGFFTRIREFFASTFG